MKADLHMHTTVSDGTLTAEDILKIAVEEGITHLAFTDHDTVKDCDKHVALAAAYGIFAVRGIELSAMDQETGKKVHILGYNYKTTDHLEAFGGATLKKREANCIRQIELLAANGYDITVEKIRTMADTCIYKQHILDYLVKTGQSEALFGRVYKEIFKNGGYCDFDIEYPDAADAVRAVCADGGFAVLAHPGQQQNFYIVKRLVDAGLSGIERMHPSNSAADMLEADRLCREYGLFQTGGSDFHGKYEATVRMPGTYPAPEGCLKIF